MTLFKVLIFRVFWQLAKLFMLEENGSFFLKELFQFFSTQLMAMLKLYQYPCLIILCACSWVIDLSDSSWQWGEIGGRGSRKEHILLASVLSNKALSQNDGHKHSKIIRDGRELCKIGITETALTISQSCPGDNVKLQREKWIGEVRILYTSQSSYDLLCKSPFLSPDSLLHSEDFMSG